jgi:hypothetical protein
MPRNEGLPFRSYRPDSYKLAPLSSDEDETITQVTPVTPVTPPIHSMLSSPLPDTDKFRIYHTSLVDYFVNTIMLPLTSDSPVTPDTPLSPSQIDFSLASEVTQEIPHDMNLNINIDQEKKNITCLTDNPRELPIPADNTKLVIVLDIDQTLGNIPDHLVGQKGYLRGYVKNLIEFLGNNKNIILVLWTAGNAQHALALKKVFDKYNLIQHIIYRRLRQVTQPEGGIQHITNWYTPPSNETSGSILSLLTTEGDDIATFDHVKNLAWLPNCQGRALLIDNSYYAITNRLLESSVPSESNADIAINISNFFYGSYNSVGEIITEGRRDYAILEIFFVIVDILHQFENNISHSVAEALKKLTSTEDDLALLPLYRDLKSGLLKLNHGCSKRDRCLPLLSEVTSYINDLIPQDSFLTPTSTTSSQTDFRAFDAATISTPLVTAEAKPLPQRPHQPPFVTQTALRTSPFSLPRVSSYHELPLFDEDEYQYTELSDEAFNLGSGIFRLFSNIPKLFESTHEQTADIKCGHQRPTKSIHAVSNN